MQELLAGELTRVRAWRRLEAARAVDVHDERLRVQLDGLSARTAAATGLPMAAVTVLDEFAAVFAGSSGFDGWLARAGGVAVELAPCVSVVAAAAPVVIGDLRADAVQRHNPLVRHCGLGAYAGAPVLHAGGQVLGAACVLGARAHVFTAEDITALQAAAAEAAAILGGHSPLGATAC